MLTAFLWFADLELSLHTFNDVIEEAGTTDVGGVRGSFSLCHNCTQFDNLANNEVASEGRYIFFKNSSNIKTKL